jgi:pimeloyl-ACP methyl ester carboxylesterase
MSRQVLDLPRGPLEVWRSGVGPTVVVAHGCGYGGSYRNSTWLAQELPNHHVISVSRPGYGGTPLSTATTFHDQAAMYVDVLDALGVEDCVVLGMSASGPIALLAARDFAPRVRGLVLWCALARSLPGHEIDEDRVSLEIEALEDDQAAERAVFTRMLSDESFALEALPELLRPAEMARYSGDPTLRAHIRSYLEEHLVAPPAVAAVRNDLLQVRALLGEGLDSRVAVPMLVIHGDADQIVPSEHARYLAAVNPHAELDIIAGAGHGFMHTFRPEVMFRMRAFLHRSGREARAT